MISLFRSLLQMLLVSSLTPILPFVFCRVVSAVKVYEGFIRD